MAKLNNFKNKKIYNLLSSIEKSKNVDWASYIFSLGILSIGKKTAFILSKKFANFDSLKSATLQQLTDIQDIGEIVAQNIMDYFQDEDNITNIQKMFEIGVNIRYPNLTEVNSQFKNLKIVLTGALENFGRSQLTTILQEKGADVTTSVSKNTDLVIAGSEAGSKLAKAQALGVKVIDEKTLLDMLNGEK